GVASSRAAWSQVALITRSPSATLCQEVSRSLAGTAARSATYVPEPGRVATTPSALSTARARATVIALTRYLAMSSRLVGRRAPVGAGGCRGSSGRAGTAACPLTARVATATAGQQRSGAGVGMEEKSGSAASRGGAGFTVAGSKTGLSSQLVGGSVRSQGARP